MTQASWSGCQLYSYVKRLEGLQHYKPFQMLAVSELLGTIPALLHITCSLTLHNHPTGDPTPSREDMEITRRLTEAGDLLGIKVLDHIIIGDNYLSFVEQGLI